MASVAEIEDLIKQIGESSDGSMAALSEDKVLASLAEKNEQLQSALSEAETEDDKTAITNRFNETFKSHVNEQIATMQTAHGEIKAGIKNVIETIKSAIQTTAIPPAIGVPPVVPNPAYALAENKQKVDMINMIIETLRSAFLQLLTAAKNIDFAVPDSVIQLLETLVTIKKLTSTIPAIL